MRCQGSESIIDYELESLCSVSFPDAEQTISILDLPKTDHHYTRLDLP